MNCYETRKKSPFPLPAVDIIIVVGEKVVLIKRKNPPLGWAIPGGFIEKGESAEQAARREAKEETSLELKSLKQFGVYSDPGRDSRFHTISVVFTALARGQLQAKSDASRAELFEFSFLPEKMAFDHRKILGDFIKEKYG